MPPTFPETKADWNSPTAPTASTNRFRAADWNNLIDQTPNVINVKGPSYGAKGDGVTDDTAAIQAAVDAAAANAKILWDYGRGSTVYMPRGVYKTTGTVLVKPGVSLVGSGARTTAIHIVANNTTDAIQFSQPVTDWADSTLRGFGVYSAAPTDSRDLISYPANTWGHIIIDDVIVEGAGRFGFYFVGSQEVRMINCRSRTSKSAGIRIGDGASSFTTYSISRTYFSGTTDGPGAEVMVLGGQTAFNDCIFESNGATTKAVGHGILVHGGTVSMTHPYFENNGGDAMHIGDTNPTWFTVINPIFFGGPYLQAASKAGFFDGATLMGSVIGGKWDGNDTCYTGAGTGLWFATAARVGVFGADVGGTPPVWQGGALTAYPAPLFYNDGAGNQSIGGTLTIGTANGLSLSGSALSLAAAGAAAAGAVTTGSQTLAGAKTFSSDITVGSTGTGTVNAQAMLAASNGAIQVIAQVPSNGTGSAFKIRNTTALTTSGDRAMIVYRDNGTNEVAAIQRNANTYGIRLQSPDGTWYLLTIANGGTVNIAAAP